MTKKIVAPLKPSETWCSRKQRLPFEPEKHTTTLHSAIESVVQGLGLFQTPSIDKDFVTITVHGGFEEYGHYESWGFGYLVETENWAVDNECGICACWTLYELIACDNQEREPMAVIRGGRVFNKRTGKVTLGHQKEVSRC